eukprot:TRINITY_DN100383_c0_g1_i1.p1 TRINITY_DN100383_c0_g1~~TRINITY_DN100383_c0_g1_i1.p1  ORF type:complete len:429 (-),score=57.35 TRINITY_DN100383_c0_g1_i1:984-2270(-)
MPRLSYVHGHALGARHVAAWCMGFFFGVLLVAALLQGEFSRRSGRLKGGAVTSQPSRPSKVLPLALGASTVSTSLRSPALDVGGSTTLPQLPVIRPTQTASTTSTPAAPTQTTSLSSEGDAALPSAMLPSPQATRGLQNGTIVLLHLISDHDQDHAGCKVDPAGRAAKQREKNMEGFKSSLPIMRKKFLRKYPYPITIFYSPYAGWEKDLKKLKAWLGPDTPVEGVPIPCFDEEHFYPKQRAKFHFYRDTCNDPSGCSQFPFAYRQMNYIFTYGMFFDSPALSKYKYWMRIDADAWIEDVVQDPFEQMAQNGWVFAYRQAFTDAICNVHYRDEVREYVRKNKIKPKDNKFFWDYTERWINFYGNLGAGYVPFFQNDHYKKLITHILDGGWLWWYRWDDQHTYAMACSLFGLPSQVGPIKMKVKHNQER